MSDDPIDDARERQHERTAGVEEIVDETLEGVSYPTNASEMKAAYGETRAEVANETEAMGDVFDRLENEEYDTYEDAREAVLGELTGRAGEEHGDSNEYNRERELDALEEEESESYGGE